jgi:hypothetical protein
MNQSEVSRLERRRDLRLSSLRRYAEAVGGRLRPIVTWSDGSREIELVIGEPEAPTVDRKDGVR